MIHEGDGRYCAKELLSDKYLNSMLNDPELLKKADIFSFGLTFLKLLKGNNFELDLNGTNWNKIRNNEFFFDDIQ